MNVPYRICHNFPFLTFFLSSEPVKFVRVASRYISYNPPVRALLAWALWAVRHGLLLPRVSLSRFLFSYIFSLLSHAPLCWHYSWINSSVSYDILFIFPFYEFMHSFIYTFTPCSSPFIHYIHTNMASFALISFIRQ